MTLCHGLSFWACLNGTICSHIACFSSRKSAENPGVVVTTMFLPRDLDIVATIGPLIPLSRNALLKAFLSWSGEKLVLLLDVDWIKMRRFEVFGLGFGCWPIVGFLPTVVHSWAVVVVVVAATFGPIAAILAKVGCLGGLGWVWVGVGTFDSALALDSICRVVVSRLAIWELMIFEAFWSFLSSVYSLKTSRRSRSLAFSTLEVVRVYASTRRSLASRIALLAAWLLF